MEDRIDTLDDAELRFELRKVIETNINLHKQINKMVFEIRKYDKLAGQIAEELNLNISDKEKTKEVMWLVHKRIVKSKWLLKQTMELMGADDET